MLSGIARPTICSALLGCLKLEELCLPSRKYIHFVPALRSSLDDQEFERVQDSGETLFKSAKKNRKNADELNREIVKISHVFKDIPDDLKNKAGFDSAIGTFLQHNVHRRGQIEFIYAALSRMKQFGVHKDLEAYKRLLLVFPRGKMIGKTRTQTAFYYYPKHQECAIDVMCQMEDYAVHPDKEIYEIVRQTFGEWAYAMRKMKRMMYWMPKFKNLSPYPVPKELPSDDAQLAMVALKRMHRDPAHQISLFYAEEEKENTWVASAQSPEQIEHIRIHRRDESLYVDGPFTTWLDTKQVTYFVLLANPDPSKVFNDVEWKQNWTIERIAKWKSRYNSEMSDNRRQLIAAPSFHEQPEGTILALSCTGTGSRESLAHWISFLQKLSPRLAEIPIVFRLDNKPADIQIQGDKFERDKMKTQFTLMKKRMQDAKINE